MASWSETTKHSPSDINGGNKYEAKDRVSREQLNAITENSLFAVKKSEEALDKANSAFEANGTLVTINGVPQTSWSADFAESERQKSLGEDGAIVHEKQIADVERIGNKTTTESEFIINRTSTTKYPSNENVDYVNRGLIKPNDNSTTVDEFLDYVKNTLEYGIYKFYKNFGGSFVGFIVFKVNLNYATVMKFEYYINSAIQVNVLNAGAWSGWKNVQLS